MFCDGPNCMQTVLCHVHFASCGYTRKWICTSSLTSSVGTMGVTRTPSALRLARTEYAHGLPSALVQIVHPMCLKKAAPFLNLSRPEKPFRLCKPYRRTKGRAPPATISLTSISPYAALFIEATVVPYNGHPALIHFVNKMYESQRHSQINATNVIPFCCKV